MTPITLTFTFAGIENRHVVPNPGLTRPLYREPVVNGTMLLGHVNGRGNPEMRMGWSVIFLRHVVVDALIGS